MHLQKYGQIRFGYFEQLLFVIVVCRVFDAIVMVVRRTFGGRLIVARTRARTRSRRLTFRWWRWWFVLTRPWRLVSSLRTRTRSWALLFSYWFCVEFIFCAFFAFVTFLFFFRFRRRTSLFAFAAMFLVFCQRFV